MQWSLEDIYKKQVRGNIPQRKHLRVLGEAQVDITYDGGEAVAFTDIDDKKAASIASYLKGEAEGSIMLKENFKVVQALADKSGFRDQDKFLKYLFMGFQDVNYEGLQKLVDEKDGLNVLGSKLAGPIGKVDLWDICKPQLGMFLENQEDWGLFYNMLFVQDFKEGNVSVGAGELALAVLTEAKKGAAGDLEIGSLQIEVKTGKGRVLSARGSGFADDNQRILEIITNNGVIDPKDPEAEPTLDNIDKSFWNNKYAKNVLTKENLKRVLEMTSDPNLRKQYVGALLLHEYGRKGEGKGGFDIILAVHQHGFDANKSRTEAEFQHRVEAGQDRRDKKGRYAKGIPGTWWDANYVNVNELDSIFRALKNNLIRFEFGGEGVSIFYPGSSSSAAGKAGMPYRLT